jgi:hypothetical protein
MGHQPERRAERARRVFRGSNHKTKRKFLTASLAQSKLEPTMSDYYDYLHKRMAPIPPDVKRAMPKVVEPQEPLESLELSQPDVPMTVEESTATDTIIERVKAFWRK